MESALIIARDFPGIEADPEHAVVRFVKRGNMAAMHFRGVVVIENREAHAIVTNEAATRAEPEIAIPGLDDGGNVVVRQPIFAHLPETTEPMRLDDWRGVNFKATE